MAREIIDRLGRHWKVWAVRPGTVERRYGAPDRRPLPRHERRRGAGAQDRAAISNSGWLVCETAGEKRRLAPIPSGWESLSDEALAELCVSARRVRPSRRLIE